MIEQEDHSNDPEFSHAYMEAFITFMLYERGGTLTLKKEMLDRFAEKIEHGETQVVWDAKTETWCMQLPAEHCPKKVLIKVPGRKRKKIYRPNKILVPGLITIN